MLTDLRAVFRNSLLTFLLFYAVEPQTSWASDGRRVALVIGNTRYIDVPSLENPARDARLIGEKLRSVGFDVDLVTEGDQATLMQRVRSFGRKAVGAEAALFYYAGHGLQANGRNYLLPVDAKIERLADLRYESLPLAAVMDELEHAGAQINLVVLDACRDNPLARSLTMTSGTRKVELARGLASLQRARGTFIAYATAPGEVAYDGEGQRNSPFTKALADWIDQPGLEVALMFRRIREQVVEATDGRQTPWVEEAILGDFYFRREAPDMQPKPTETTGEAASSFTVPVKSAAKETQSQRSKASPQHGPTIQIIEGQGTIPKLF